MSALRRGKGQRPVSSSIGIPPVPPAWLGPFLGVGPDGPVCAGPQHAVLVLGPPRSGKTSSVVVPNVLTAPAAVVSTSTKSDVLDATVDLRLRRGRCWLFDPTGMMPVPAHVSALRWSPVPGCQRWDHAVATARALVSAGRPPAGLSESTHWIERAEALLAPLLHAAALDGLDMSWVMRWVLRRELTEPAMLIGSRGGELAGDVLGGIAGTEERERSGIFSTAAGVLAAYRNEAALAAACAPNFDPWAFVHTSDTVFICAPSAQQQLVAPLVVALLEEIRRATFARAQGWPPMLWALDEVANIAPLDSLPAVVSEGGSQGLVTVACLQDLSQARNRWGVQADGFLSLFATKILLPGIVDIPTLEAVSKIAGQAWIELRSRTAPALPIGRTPVTTTTSWQQVPRLPVDEVARGVPGFGLMVQGAERPSFIRLVPYWDWPFSQLCSYVERRESGSARPARSEA